MKATNALKQEPQQGRNFRKHFYSYLYHKGVSTSQFSQIDIIIENAKSTLIEVKLLRELLLRTNCKFPSKQRASLWKLFLNIYSPIRENWSFVDKHNFQLFKEIDQVAEYSVELIGPVQELLPLKRKTSVSEFSSLQTILKSHFMKQRLSKVYVDDTEESWILDAKPQALDKHSEDEEVCKMYMARVFLHVNHTSKLISTNISEEDAQSIPVTAQTVSEAFWCFEACWARMLATPQSSMSWQQAISFMTKELEKLLAQHDTELYNILFLVHQSVCSNHFKKWFGSLFALHFSLDSLIRIWDCCNFFSSDFAIYFALSVLKTHKSIIVGASTSQDTLQKVLSNLRELDVEPVIMQAIEMFKPLFKT